MADITEHPADGSAEKAAPAPDSPPPGPLPGFPEDAVYRPVSLLAILGFCLSVLFGVAMSVTALIALFTRSTLLPPVWICVIPVIAIGVCWMARERIRQSENTQSGEKLAGWGLGLSVIVTVLYGAYYWATYLAVTQQASDFADRWIEALKEGNPEHAYWYLIDPRHRVDIPPPVSGAQDAKLRERLEMEFSGGNTRNTPYNEFRRGRVLTLFRRGGAGTTVRRVGVADWSYDKGSYEVVLRYRIGMPEANADMLVRVASQEPVMAEFDGRQWFVLGKGSSFDDPTMHPTPLGEEHRQETRDAFAFAEEWDLGMPSTGVGRHYLATVPAAEREAAGKELKRAMCGSFPALSGGGVLAALDAASRKQLIGRRSFQQGDLVDTSEFWALSPKIGDDVKARIKRFFAGHSSFPQGRIMFPNIMAPNTGVPVREEKNGHVLIAFDVTLNLLNDDRTGALYEVPSQLVVEGIEDAANPGHRLWHIHRLKLISARRPDSSQRAGR
jgi:hypothetical protein